MKTKRCCQQILRSILIVSLLTIGLASSGLAQTTYTITDLGSLGYSSVGQGINASGQVTGYSQGTDFTIHAFLYSGGSMADLGNLGDSFSVGTGINASGQVTGYSAGTDHNIHAFLYSGGSMTDLGTLGGSSSNGFGMNDYGQVTGTSLMPDTNVHAFLYTPGTGMVDLNSLLPSGSGWTLITGNGINNSGQVTGYYYTATSSIDAFLYSLGFVYDLGTLGGNQTIGQGINGFGEVTGFSYTTGNSIFHAFLYSGGSMTDLGTLGGGYSNGLGINNSRQVTGYSYTTGNSAQHAFLYTPGTGMVDLNSLLPSGSGWTLINGNGINDAGQITGDGLNPNGADHAFLLSPTAPFSAFAAKLEISGTPPTSFEINGSFTLGAGSNGINPVNEAVTLKLGTFSVTMPQGSFKKSHGGRYVFEGTIDGAALELGIVPVTTNTYTFNAEGSGANLSGTVKPVSVVLTIGDDNGATTAKTK
jgi:probable HAF family extracellular repeat protein